MKKLLALLLAALMLIGAVACGMTAEDGKIPGDGDPTTDNKNDTNNTGNNQNNTGDMTDTQNGANNAPATYANAHELLAVIWAAHGSEEKFPAMGGDYDNVVENAPGSFDLTHAEAAANIDSLISFPSDQIEQIDDAASLIHSMNANTFTCGAFRFKSADAAKNMAGTIKNHILTKQFICGTPEKLTILYAPDHYLIVAYGATSVVDAFCAKAQGVIANNELLVEQPLV